MAYGHCMLMSAKQQDTQYRQKPEESQSLDRRPGSTLSESREAGRAEGSTLHSRSKSRILPAMKPRIPLLLLLLLFGLSCSDRKPNPPPGVLPPEQFARLYADLLRQGVQTPASARDTLQERREVDSILALHGTSREAVQASVQWYNRDYETWKTISDSVTASLERAQAGRP